MTELALRDRLLALSEASETERVDERHFLGVFTLDSGYRYGLVFKGNESTPSESKPSDDEPCDHGASALGWAVWTDDGLQLFTERNASHFVEVLEHRRSDFDEQLERGAVELGLPALETLLSFPAVALIRVILTSFSQHFISLGLRWLLPSELRELREEIQRVANDKLMPQGLRELAAHLVVPG